MVKMGKWDPSPAQNTDKEQIVTSYREPARDAVIGRIEKLEGDLGWRLRDSKGFGKYAQIREQEIKALSDEISRLRKSPQYRSFIADKARAIETAVVEDARLAEEAERQRNRITLPEGISFQAARKEGSTAVSTGVSAKAFKPK